MPLRNPNPVYWRRYEVLADTPNPIQNQFYVTMSVTALPHRIRTILISQSNTAANPQDLQIEVLTDLNIYTHDITASGNIFINQIFEDNQPRLSSGGGIGGFEHSDEGNEYGVGRNVHETIETKTFRFRWRITSVVEAGTHVFVLIEYDSQEQSS